MLTKFAIRLKKESQMISIVTATIGRDSLLRALDNIDGQTYTDWEHVVVVDGGPLNDSLLVRITENPKRNLIQIQKSKQDHGKSPQNIGIIGSQGDFVTLLDDDNEWLPGHLESMIKPFQDDSSIQIVFCPLTMIHFNSDNLREERHFSLSCGKVDAGNFLARREVFYRNGLFWAPNRRSYDWELIKKITTINNEKYFVINERNFLYYTPKP